MQPILIVEDDAALAKQIVDLFERYRYTCRAIDSFDDVDVQVATLDPALVLLDVNLPRYDGFYWCRRIRESSHVPILMVSARDAVSDQVRGMEAGADDYMTKPFDLDVLLAKVQAQMRRNYGELGVSAHGLASVKRDGITFYPGLQRVEWDGRVVELSAVESSLFACLMKAYPETASRSDLYMAAWDDESYVEANTLNVNIRRLRDCFARAGIPVEIKVVRTVGYRLSIDGDGS
ncbi:response regulator transcription factor [Slackia exigua]|uniref:response regulator transcription factor n=1 Tax=Slackia exigua TaxID=84109 RepID=UPI0028DC671C|nr:response regulator transcription factor [Slackia exigua]